LTGAGLRRLFVSMDGVLDWLPVQILRAPEWPWNKYLIDDYEISYLGAARDLLRTTIDIGARPLVLGLDHFDSDQEYGPSAEDITRSNRCQQPSFLPLANAEEEARRIGAKLDAEVWTGSNEVTKDRVMKRLEHIDQQIRDTTFRSPAILHIISHGFGLAPEQSSQQSDALLLSGLALSGAELWAPQLESGGQLPETHPGVLNAREISGLDLRETQLSVLSACETGLGPVTSGEGVFGLQRAFFLAGSQSIVLALWRVHDSSTALLMENFYTHLHSGASRSAALRSAQIAIRRRFPMPLHWAVSFVRAIPGHSSFSVLYYLNPLNILYEMMKQWSTNLKCRELKVVTPS
jgi:CHAT domain-containing protein